MKKSLIFLTIFMFCFSSLYAAPATKNTATSTQKKTKKKPRRSIQEHPYFKITPKTRAQKRQEERYKEFGLMPSEVDKQNRNVFQADAAAIRGARDTESAMRYLPFVTIVNTTGFGNQFDLRGQGRVSSNGLDFQINGITMTPLDTYYGFMPINTILPSLIHNVTILPGVEDRGGTINVITSKRDAPFFLIGGGYVNTATIEGHSFNAFAQAADKVGTSTLMNTGLAYTQMGGPREKDKSQNAQGVLGVTYDLGDGQNLLIDVDFFWGKNKTTPLNSFLDGDAINKLVLEKDKDAQGREALYKEIEQLPYFKPSKDSRALAGDGDIETTEQRLVGSLDYRVQPTENFKTDFIIFYTFDKRKFNKYEMYIPYYGYGGASRWAPHSEILKKEANKKNAWNLLDQSGSSFNEKKMGVKVALETKHNNGEFFAGYNGIYEKSERNPVQLLRSALTAGVGNHNVEIKVNNKLDTTKFTNTFYIKERYDFSKKFSILGGFKYETMNFAVKALDNMNFGAVNYDSLTDTATPVSGTPRTFDGESKKNYDNFLFEVAPAFRYSDTGVIYGRFESGYITPPGYSLLQRDGEFDSTKPADSIKSFNYSNNDIKQESYMTGEFGWRELIGTRRIPLGFTSFDVNAFLFSASAFYTKSKDEFYFSGDAYAGMRYGTYKESRRMGVEIALEQYFLDGIIGLNESYTYLKAQHFGEVNGEEKWDTIPYTYDYKATLGLNINASALMRFIDISLGLWLQNSFYGNQKIIDKDFISKDPNTKEIVQADNQTTLKPYIISDFGVSIGVNKDMGVISAGIKNVFDTFYYDYYNNDRAATINENRYIIGRGRTIFVEGTFRY